MSVPPLQVASLVLMAVGVLLATGRFVMGPTTADRIVAADTLNILVTAGLVYLAHLLGSNLYLGVALVYGALSFVGTVALARAIEGDRS
jgi:multicomponent Na+:H+ antiporter subunit F